MNNIYKEEKVKGMRCPFPIQVTKSLECEGSSCMAWRWQADYNGTWEEIEPTEGYCGLAGKP